MPFCYSERALARVSTVRHHARRPDTSFLVDFLGNCAIAFPICPLMLQKCAFRYFGPTGLPPDFGDHRNQHIAIVQGK
jgi:hypothetical protein